MINPDRQKRQFADRLTRIAAGGENTMSQIYVGPAEEPVTDRKGKRKHRPARAVPSLKENIGYPISIIWAFAIGLLAVLITRYVRNALAGGTLTGEDADIMMAIDGGLALAVGFVLTQMFRVKGKAQETAKTAGIVVMIGMMHNMVHAWPGAFELTFSPEWVTDVVETTEPKSFLFRGISFALGDTKEQSAGPKLIEMNSR